MPLPTRLCTHCAKLFRLPQCPFYLHDGLLGLPAGPHCLLPFCNRPVVPLMGTPPLQGYVRVPLLVPAESTAGPTFPPLLSAVPDLCSALHPNWVRGGNYLDNRPPFPY